MTSLISRFFGLGPQLMAASLFVLFVTPNVVAINNQLFVPAGGSPFPLSGGFVRSIAVGDFNGDGKLDVITAGFYQPSSRYLINVLLGNGVGGFTQAPGSPLAVGYLTAFSVVVGDFNRDGKLDFAVTDYPGQNVTVLLGDGQGRFTPAAGSPFAAGTNPVSMVTGDFNRDGKLDLAFASDLGNVTVLLGDGSGGFTPDPAGPFGVGSNPQYLATGDVNGDGKLDLVTANYDSNSVSVLLGDGSGGFAPSASSPFAAGTNPKFIAVADFNGDGKLDIATANYMSSDVSILLGNGSGGFSPVSGSPFAVGQLPQFLAIADFNGDGKLDIVTSNAQSGNLTILLGTGSGVFTQAAGSPLNPGGTGVGALAVGDFNGDGSPDLTVGISTNGGEALAVLLGAVSTRTITANPASLTFYSGVDAVGTPTVFPASLPVTLSSTFSGVPYTAVSNQPWLRVSPSMNSTGGVSSLSISVQRGTLAAGVYSGAVTIAAPGFLLTTINVTFNVAAASGTLLPGSGISLGGIGYQLLVSGDFNGDGIADLATAYIMGSSNYLEILLGNGSDGFTVAPGSPLPIAGQPNDLKVGDVNQDGNLDLLLDIGWPSVPTKIVVLLGDGRGGFSAGPASPFPSGTSGTSLYAVGDFNGDGKLDLIAEIIPQGQLQVCFGDGQGRFAPASSGITTLPAGFVTTGDFNGDGRTDLAIANYSQYALSSNLIYLSDGSGGFTVAPGGPYQVTWSAPYALTAADLNGDGKLDLVIVDNYNNTVSVLLGDGTGALIPSGQFAVGRGPTSVIVADMDGDGKPDIVTTNGYSSDVTVLLGNGAGGFIKPSNSPFAIGYGFLTNGIIADFNRDGRLDFAGITEHNPVLLLGALAPTSAVLSTPADVVPSNTTLPLTLTVSQPKGGFQSPAGMSSFFDGSASLGIAGQSASPYLWNATGLTSGNHNFSGRFSGDNRNAPATSNTVGVQVLASGQSPVTFVTTPPGLALSIDGAAAQIAPFQLSLSTGSHTVSAASVQPASSSAAQYIFTSWSDGGAANHTIPVGSTPAAYTASYRLQYQLTAAVSPPSSGVISPASGYYDAGSILAIQAAANMGYQFANLSGTFFVNPQGPQGFGPLPSPQIFPMSGPMNVVANFTASAPALVASIGARSDVVPGVTRQAVLTLTNTGIGPAGNATITSITGITVVLGTGSVSVASGVPWNLGTIASGALASNTVLFNWPPTAVKVRFVVNFTSGAGYSSSTTITTLR